MSLIHERLYSSGRNESIDFGDYLREMVSLITSSNRPAGTEVHVDLQVQPVEVGVDKAVPLSLIASELVMNSLKHAFRDRSAGTLTVRLGCENGACRLFIGDDGPGLQRADPNSIGVGLQLIDGLTKQINAHCELSSGTGAGTTILWDQ
jgi:two-component sensor histidine kinase